MIKKLSHTDKYHSALKMETLPFAITGMHTKSIIVNENKTDTERNILLNLTYMQILKTTKMVT
jgi:hypothetical protein